MLVLGRCSGWGGSEPGGPAVSGGSPGFVGWRWVQLLFKKQQIENILLSPCFLLPAASRRGRQPLGLQTVSILCRASKNAVLNTARAGARNQINSFVIPQAFEFSALPKNC